ncbi:U2 snRNP complex subunit [Saccharomycopsis crataegensis]|uniref:U2 snRNP complex subunit n=1 Tax=Saccharomycopsis crataegensis TaxID=43959 RepID=A0AAV5QQT1_9ASCO|nr:U2 snRNP complex subunit [Saccharomycopsis crataegensis]
MSTTQQITKLTETELRNNIPFQASWHQEYNDSAYIFIGNLPQPFTEEQILTVFSQFGVPTEIKLVRDRETQESKRFAFLKYEDQLSTVLAVDNLNGITLQDRTIRVDHCYYKVQLDDDGNEILNEFDRRIRNEMLKDFVNYEGDAAKESTAGSNTVDQKHRITDKDHRSNRSERNDSSRSRHGHRHKEYNRDRSRERRYHSSSRSDRERHHHGHSHRSSRKSSEVSSDRYKEERSKDRYKEERSKDRYKEERSKYESHHRHRSGSHKDRSKKSDNENHETSTRRDGESDTKNREETEVETTREKNSDNGADLAW